MVKLLQKVAAGFCLTIGLPIVLLCVADLMSATTNAQDKENSMAALMLLGLPPTGVGTWLIFNLRHQSQQKNKQLDLAQEKLFLSLFLSLLQQHRGALTITEFAIAAELPIKEAKEYLDQKAIQLNAGFEVSEEGGIIYKFPMQLP
ncbi:MAG: hypothetical protein VKJ64_02360 [Leptolyngbyaceae bacterium]|nr:hypothetical protein [Leptolyngbyaceae bacterium]